MIVKLLTEHHLELLSLKRGCRGSSEFTHVKTPHCWKFHALAHISSLGNNKINLTYCDDCLGRAQDKNGCMPIGYLALMTTQL